MRRVERIKKCCEVCQKNILVYPRNIVRSRFCSHACKARSTIAGWNKGKKAPWAKNGHPQTEETRIKISMTQQGITNREDWEGYKRSKNYLERRTFQQTMQKLVFARDKWQCTLCYSKKDLQVDHIQPWSEYVEGRFKMENCRTLCAECHYLITFKRPMPENIKGWGHNFMKARVLI